MLAFLLFIILVVVFLVCGLLYWFIEDRQVNHNFLLEICKIIVSGVGLMAGATLVVLIVVLVMLFFE